MDQVGGVDRTATELCVRSSACSLFIISLPYSCVPPEFIVLTSYPEYVRNRPLRNTISERNSRNISMKIAIALFRFHSSNVQNLCLLAGSGLPRRSKMLQGL